jgi:hypothetical protein
VVTLVQLLELGLSRSGVYRRVRAGRLHVLYRGVFAVGHRYVSGSGRRLAAVFACGPGALLSHRSAADAWAIRRSAGARIDVLVGQRCSRAPAGVRVHRTRSLHPDDIAELGGIPITSPARTIVDCAAAATPHEIERMAHEAEVQRLLDVRAVEAALGRTPSARNAVHVRAAIGTPSPGPTRRELEDRFLALCRRHGIPDPILNARVSIPHHTPEVDALWPATKLVVELDGVAAHHTRRAFEQDRRRDADLAEAGYLVVRLTWRRVADEPDDVARQLRALAANRSQLRARA